jgi:ABC-type multidrug transport system fused ATPase/permease subunit
MGALPWVAALAPRWAPALVGLALLAHLVGLRPIRRQPWPWVAAAAAALVHLAVWGGWRVTFGWLALAVLVAGLAWLAASSPGRAWRQASWIVAVVGWAAAIAAAPELMAGGGGWIAPAVLLVAARTTGAASAVERGTPDAVLAPPSRQVRGTLSLRSLVAAGADGLPKTIPLDLELRAGQSLAVLCPTTEDAWVLAKALSGRVAPAAGELSVDGSAVASADRVVAVVGLGEPFLPGDLELNLAALCDEFPDRETVVATIDACALEEALDSLGDLALDADGSPLSAFQRLLVAAARVIPSGYRLVVVVDPMPWVNPVNAEIWRSAVVRASLGRTAIWLTSDRELATRADRLLAFRSGGLRDVDLTT